MKQKIQLHETKQENANSSWKMNFPELNNWEARRKFSE